MKRIDLMRLPLSFMLPILIGLVMLAGLSVSLYLADRQYKNELIESTAAEARTEAARFVRLAETGLAAEGGMIEREIMLYSTARFGDISAALVDPDGIALFASRAAWKNRPVASLLPDWDPQRFGRIVQGASADLIWNESAQRLSLIMPYAHPPKHGEIASNRRGAVVLQYDLSAMLAQATYKNLLLRIPSVGTVLVLTLLMLFWLHRRLSRPLARLSLAAQRIGAGDLNTAIEVSGVGEVADLAQILNQTASQLAGDRAALAQAQQTLEQRLLRASAENAIINRLILGATVGRADFHAFSWVVTELLSRHFGVERVNIWRFSEDNAQLYCIDHFDAPGQSHANGMVLREDEYADEFAALKTSTYVDASDALHDPRVAGYLDGYIKPNRISSMLDVVLRLGDRMIGLFCLEHVDRQHRWQPEEIAFACQIGVLLSSVAEEEERRKNEEIIATQNQVLQMLANGRPLNEVLEALTRSIEQLSPGMLASVLLLDEAGVHLRHGAAPSLPPGYCQAIDGVSIGDNVGSCGTAAWRGRQVIVEDIASDPLWADFRDLALKYGLKACWSTPIMSAENRVLGTFAIYFPNPAKPNPQQLRLIGQAADTASIAIARERAERALRVSEQRLRSLLNETPVISVQGYDRQRRVNFWNKASEKLYGYSAGQAIGKKLEDLIIPEAMRPQVVADIERWLHGGPAIPAAELTLMKADGSPAEVFSSHVMLRNLDGEPEMYCIDIDMADLKRAQSELRKLSQAVEQSPESIIITDLQGRIEYVNAAFTENTGFGRDEVLGKNPRLRNTGKTPAQTYIDMWAALEQGKVWHGEFINLCKDGSERSEQSTIAPLRDSGGTVTHYLAVQQDVTERKLAEQQVHRLAYFDLLTGLPNRTRLIQQLAEAKQAADSHAQHALLLIDLDRFKNINNARGHMMGDEMLKQLAERISRKMEGVDIVARLSADEFAILLGDLPESPELAMQSVIARSEELLDMTRLAFHVEDDEVVMTASIGVTLIRGDSDDGPIEILRRADTALHRAKHAGGNQWVMFDDSMEQTLRQRFQIERDLRQAIPSGDLRLYLQPQVDAAGTLTGAEALVRWQHPERGLVPPGMFIPVAEETDLIVELDRWVFHEVCTVLAQEVMATSPIRLSVNISPRHFRKPGFVAWLKQVLSETGADPARLTLEVTEGLVIDNVNEVIAKMSDLSALGIHFSIDDFGTGYSSLAYLKRLPIHELKIDKTFVQDAPTDPDDAALVEVILAVASHLHLKVVAEGVETREQVDFLNQRGQVIHQGYYFGKPEPAQQLVTRCKEGCR